MHWCDEACILDAMPLACQPWLLKARCEKLLGDHPTQGSEPSPSALYRFIRERMCCRARDFCLRRSGRWDACLSQVGQKSCFTTLSCNRSVASPQRGARDSNSAKPWVNRVFNLCIIGLWSRMNRCLLLRERSRCTSRKWSTSRCLPHLVFSDNTASKVSRCWH